MQRSLLDQLNALEETMAERTAAPNYGIMYNWDGAPHGYSEYPQSLAQFLDKVYAPLADTQVGALCWCVGVHEVPWPSQQLDMVGASTERRYDSVQTMRHTENIRAFFERGEDLYGALVQRGRELGMAVLPSLRMNDNHFWDLRPGDLGSLQRSDLTPLRQQHPEWLLGEEQAPGWASTSWNMAIPEVRAYILQRVVEACRLADWDGVELDWQRHAFHLPADDAYRLRYALTDLMQAIRKQTDQIAEERGRPFHVAVRVATTFEACRRIGYDVETWVRDGLCDVVISGGNSGTDPGAEIEQFVELCRPHGVHFYAGFDSDGRQQARRLRPHGAWRVDWFRGLAQDQLARGADGVYVFNWHGHAQTHRPLLTTMGSAETLSRPRQSVHRPAPQHWPQDRESSGCRARRPPIRRGAGNAVSHADGQWAGLPHSSRRRGRDRGSVGCRRVANRNGPLVARRSDRSDVGRGRVGSAGGAQCRGRRCVRSK